MQQTEPVTVPLGYPTALIAIDESGSQSGSGRFVMGAVKVRQSGQLERAIQGVREKHRYLDREFKFSRISSDNAKVFTDLIAALEASDAHIVASVVDTTAGGSQFGRPRRGSKEAWEIHAEIISRLLAGCINKRELVSVLLDGITTPIGCSLSDTVRDVTNRKLRATGVVTAAALDSKTNDLLQVADLIAGAVRHERLRTAGTPRSDKGRVAMQLANAFDCPGLLDMRTGRVNIYTYPQVARRERRPDQLRVVPARSRRAG